MQITASITKYFASNKYTQNNGLCTCNADISSAPVDCGEKDSEDSPTAVVCVAQKENKVTQPVEMLVNNNYKKKSI